MIWHRSLQTKNMNTNIKILVSLLSLVLSVSVNAQDALVAKLDIASQALYSTHQYTEVSEEEPAIAEAATQKTNRIEVSATEDGWATLEVRTKRGKLMLQQQMAVSKGDNSIPVFFLSQLAKGEYTTIVKIEDKTVVSTIIKK